MESSETGARKPGGPVRVLFGLAIGAILGWLTLLFFVAGLGFGIAAGMGFNGSLASLWMNGAMVLGGIAGIVVFWKAFRSIARR